MRISPWACRVGGGHHQQDQQARARKAGPQLQRADRLSQPKAWYKAPAHMPYGMNASHGVDMVVMQMVRELSTERCRLATHLTVEG